MTSLITIDEIPAFSAIRDVDVADVSDALRDAVRGLHEVEDLEEYLRNIFRDLAATPHGPAEIVDILTHKVQVNGRKGLAAFILKGRSFPTVRPKHVAHQIYRLEKIAGLQLGIFAATGVILDAAKEQFASTCERLGISYCIADTDDLARLLWAYGMLCPRDGTKIRGGRCHCGYSPGSAALNLLQTDALKALTEDRQLGSSKGLIVLPTGSGKTRVSALDAKQSGALPVLYIAHTHEILDVAEAEFQAVFGEDAVAMSNTSRARTRPVVLSTIQHLARKPSLLRRNFGYVVVDEFHHAAARTYRDTLLKVTPDYLLGMTATPFRGDNQDIAQLCGGNVVVQRDLRGGIDSGILSPYQYFGCFDDTDYSGIERSATGYSVRDLERSLFVPERHAAIVRKWAEISSNKPTLAFCCSHRHAERISEAFTAEGISAATYLATTPLEKRGQMIDQLRMGALKVLCVVDVLNEGADIPFVECLLFLRPTDSKRVFIQQLGRGIRKYTGKQHCTVIDFIGNFRNAYKIVEYHDLRAAESRDGPPMGARTMRDVLDLPLNCTVTFEDRVLDIFADQSLALQHANRTNIGRILIHRYRRLSQRLGRPATAKDVDRNEILDSSLYKLVFRSWKRFNQIVQNSSPSTYM